MTVTCIPVIHYLDNQRTMINAQKAVNAGCDGIMLIEMNGNNSPLLSIAKTIKQRWPHQLVGINFLNVDSEEALDINLSNGLDLTWTDEQLTHSDETLWKMASPLSKMIKGTSHLLFTGVAFKYQQPEPNPGKAAVKAVELGFIPTTSGPATGQVAEIDRLRIIREAIGPLPPLALASGVSYKNVRSYVPYVTHVLVSTGVSSGFHDFDFSLLCKLRAMCHLQDRYKVVP